MDKPIPGDVVVFYDLFAHKMRTGVIDSSAAYPDDLMMVVIDASAFRPRGNPEHVSCSGGPCPGVSAENLKHIGLRDQRFWDWGGNLPGAGKGVEYQKIVNVWASDATI